MQNSIVQNCVQLSPGNTSSVCFISQPPLSWFREYKFCLLHLSTSFVMVQGIQVLSASSLNILCHGSGNTSSVCFISQHPLSWFREYKFCLLHLSTSLVMVQGIQVLSASSLNLLSHGSGNTSSVCFISQPPFSWFREVRVLRTILW